MSAIAVSEETNDESDEEQRVALRRARLFDLTHRFRVGNLVTRTSDGLLRARPMTLALVDESSEELGFFALAASDAAREVESEPMVSVVLQDGRHHVAWSGRAYVDRERYRIARAWQPELARWFPEGPEDPGLVMLVVRAIRAEYWSASVVTGALRVLGAATVSSMEDAEDAPARHGVVVFGDEGSVTDW